MSGARVYRVGSPFNGVELADIDFEQSADTMYLAHIDHAPTKLVRADHTDWTFSTLTLASTVPAPTGLAVSVTDPNTDSANSGNAYFPQPAQYVVTTLNDATGRESRPPTPVSATNDLTLKRNFNTLTWNAAGDRYRIYKAENSGDFGYIGTTDQLTFTDDNIGPDLSDGPPQAFDPFPGTDDYPSTVSFYQQRLILGRTNNHPNAIWGSRSGDYENFDISRPLKDSDSLTFALVAGRVNAVNQIVSMSDMLALTSDSVFKVTGGQQGYLSPTNIVTNRENGRGSSRLSPLVVDTVAFYQTSVGNTIRTLGYQFENNGYNSNDITIYSPHLFKDFNIVAWAYAQEPRSLILAVRDDGQFLLFTWEQEQQVWGWTLCETDGLVKNVCAISENGEDRFYLTVERTIGGVQKRFVERMASARYDGVENSCFLDCAVTYVFDAPAAILNNLDHLEGRTISALADGQVVGGLVVSGGQVTLPFTATTVTAGLPFTALVETLPLAIQSRAGWTIAKRQTAAKAVVKVVDTRGIKVGPSDTKLEEPRSRTAEPLGSPPSLITGDVETFLQPEINGGVKAVVQSDVPLPMTVTAILLDPNLQE